MATAAHLPTPLNSLRTYLVRADELKRASALASFTLRGFAMQLGMTFSQHCSPLDMAFLMALMDELESEKNDLGDPTVEAQVKATTDLAKDLYGRAKASDKPEKEHMSASDKWVIMEAARVAQAFHASAVLLDALRQFDQDLPPALASIQKHAHSRSHLLGARLATSLSMAPPIPIEWRPTLPSALPAKPKPERAPEPAPEPAPELAPEPAPAAAPPPPCPADLDTPLPPGWEMRTDPKTQRVFYVNASTRTTQWQRPVATPEDLLPPPPAPPPAPPLPARVTVTFAREGPVGLLLGDAAGGAVVGAVDPASQAEEQGVPLGAMVIKLNEENMLFKSKGEVSAAIAKAGRPLTMVLQNVKVAGSEAAPSAPTSVAVTVVIPQEGPVGLLLGDAPGREGALIRGIDEGSQAAEVGVPLGGLIVSLNGASMVGKAKAEVSAEIGKASRPLTMVLAVPVDATTVPVVATTAPAADASEAAAPAAEEFVQVTKVFEREGPCGLLLADLPGGGGGALVRSVDAGSQAAEQGMPVGASIISLNGATMAGKTKADVSAAIAAAARPLTMVLGVSGAAAASNAEPAADVVAGTVVAVDVADAAQLPAADAAVADAPSAVSSSALPAVRAAIFEAAYEYRDVPEGATLPAGLQVEMPLDGAAKRARIPATWQLKVSIEGEYLRQDVTRATTVTELRAAAAKHAGWPEARLLLGGHAVEDGGATVEGLDLFARQAEVSFERIDASA